MIGYANYDDTLQICLNMRAADADEIYNVRHTSLATPESLAEVVMSIKSIGGLAFIAYGKDGEPIACFGASEHWKGMWSVFMFATDRFSEVSLTVTRYLKKNMMPFVKSMGARRAECMSAKSHTVAHEWLRALGAAIEGTKEKYGATGEDYYCFVWINED